MVSCDTVRFCYDSEQYRII